MRVVGLRGAITCTEDSAAEIEAKTQRVVKELLTRNEVADADLVSIIVTTTPDLTATYPASSVRALGYDDVPLLGAVEAGVAGGLPRCIRVLVHCYSSRSRAEVQHVYLEEARNLRADLPQ
ncbi:MAG: chorismate mutase [Acidimicrobiia bacterium]